MNINKHFVVDPECELYHRGSYGHGCEISRYPERGFSGHLPPPPVPSGLSVFRICKNFFDIDI